MFNYIAVFLPSIFSMKIDNKLLEKKYNIETIINYLIYCLINNLLTIIIFIFIFKSKYDIWESLNLYPGMTVKYILVSIIFAVLNGFISVIIKKNVGIKVEIKNK